MNICDYAWGLASDQHMPLILDVVEGLCYLHQLNIVHGGLSPESVTLSDYGQALITGLDASFEKQGSNLPTRALEAANKLTRDDTQTLVDFMELVVKDHPHLPESNLIGWLLHSVMHALISENDDGKTYEARGLKVCVYVEDRSWIGTNIIERLALWENASHPNLLPFHGVFHDDLIESPRLCVVLPSLENGTLEDYAPTLSQKSRMLLVSDVANGLAYLQNNLSVHDYLTGQGVVISDEGRALIAAFSAKFVYFKAKSFSSWVAYRDRFLPSDAEMDEIDNQAWNLIMKCCASDADDQPNCSQIQEMLADMEIEEDRRPSATLLPLPEIQVLRSRPEVNPGCAETVLRKVQAETLKEPLSELIENHTKDMAAAVVQLKQDDIQTVVDFLDQALKEILTITEERNRVLAVLSRITSSTLIFPQRFELKGIKHGPRKFIDEGGCGTVYQGADPTICIKLMKRLDTGALMPWIKEVILWAHSSHPNVLPFLGVFLEGQSDSPQPCLVSPFMKSGNLKNYAARLPQKSRLPLISDVVNGLQYLHDLGVVHGDLKGENVLISDEGRGLITDFGTSHINTASAATGSLSSTTLRFSAPETVLGNKKPTKEFDIWSLGCLFYAILSRKPPFYQYQLEVQIIAALTRKEVPKRPGFSDEDDAEKDEFDWDDDIKQDYDAIDDQAWSLVVKCCAPEPEDRPDIARIRELVVDLKIHDDRPVPKDVPGAGIMKSRVEPKINLNRVEELFDQIRDQIQAHIKADSTDA
ncbi:Mitogen-activated protein kinase kinase kinase 5 [Leucoagaricus sp. SymC.cos]|nr:Mitogen-activated protein kinase kinase kinase 5 [Leucoagaricus sp. SymC.cos]